MLEWLSHNALQLFTLAVGFVLVVGQWKARQDFTTADVARNTRRIENLERFTSQERARLDSIYLRRDLSEAQLRHISEKLEVIDKRIARMEQTR